MKHAQPASLGLLIVLAACLDTLPARAQVYSVTICDQLIYKVDHSWLVGTPSRHYGLIMYHERNEKGMMVHRTMICLGKWNPGVSIRGTTLGWIGGAGLLASAWFAGHNRRPAPRCITT